MSTELNPHTSHPIEAPVFYASLIYVSYDICHMYKYMCVRECSVAQLYSLFATPWTITHQALLSMEFPRQEHWSGLPFPSPRSDTMDPYKFNILILHMRKRASER